MRRIRLAPPCIGRGEKRAVGKVLSSGWITTGGEAADFEREFAAYLGARHAVAVSSCTAAMELALIAMGIGPGDEVIVPTMTFVATAHAVLYAGARPVLADVESDTLCLSPEAFEAAIGPRTRAVIPVHYAGHPCDMRAIRRIARARGIEVIEDAAHAVGTSYRGRPVGASGRAVCFSFYATKNLTTAEGGMFVSSNGAIASRVRRLSYFGMTRNAWARYGPSSSWRYDVDLLGKKCNMTDIQAAIGRVQLARFDRMQGRRRRAVAEYMGRLAPLEERGLIVLPVERRWAGHSWHLFVVRITGGERMRGRLIGGLAKAGIQTSLHFVPLHRLAFYRRMGFKRASFPNAERAFGEIVSLPLHAGISPADAAAVSSAISKILG